MIQKYGSIDQNMFFLKFTLLDYRKNMDSSMEPYFYDNITRQICQKT